MTTDPDDGRAAADRRRRMAAIFGDPLPERTRDELPDGGAEDGPRGGARDDDDWLRSQVPPHHG